MPPTSPSVPEMMSTGEVAEYLRIKQRKVYDLVQRRRIPCSRVAGKWLFPRHLVEAWVLAGVELSHPALPTAPPPAVIAGSHDPLLEWSLAASGCGLAMLPGGSLDGIERLAAGEAAAALVHLVEADTGSYELSAVRQRLGGYDIVALTWARRRQGLVLAPGNPLAIEGLADLPGRRLALRQRQAGSHGLLEYLLGRKGLALADLSIAADPCRSELDLALAVREGNADAGLAIEAVARQLGLDFVALHTERCDLVLRRRAYFEAPLGALVTFMKGPAFAQRAAALGGYDVSNSAQVVYNSA